MTLRFLDTNVVLYSVSQDAREAEKRRRAIDLLKERGNAVSVQVMQEFYTQAMRASGSARLPLEAALAIASGLRRFPVQPMTVEVFDAAMEIKAATRFSYWDSAILAAARALGCAELLTEDMQHGQVVDSVRIVDPFR